MKIMLHTIIFTIITLTKLYNCCTIYDINRYAYYNRVCERTYKNISAYCSYDGIKIINDNTTKLSPEIFARVENMFRYLDSSNGSIETIKSFTFKKMYSLKYLLLNNNQISDLEPNAFNLLNNLKYL
ncbi:amphoterin-induced protein 2-like, partial [Chrysoperla carnea]|uniref:amphoterin-induced protein 2-like n=1 Tax=Chrysoperla carnea TaxID=189513 RepID=UPI001D065848